MTTHKLIDDTLITTKDGVVAKCICGYVSRPCFSSFIASLEFRNHCEFAEKYSGKNAGIAIKEPYPRQPRD